MQKIVLTTVEELKELLREAIKEEIAEQIFVTNEVGNPPDESECFLSLEDASNFLGCCTNTLLRLRKENKVPYTRVGRQIKINKQTLIKLLKSNKL